MFMRDTPRHDWIDRKGQFRQFEIGPPRCRSSSTAGRARRSTGSSCGPARRPSRPGACGRARACRAPAASPASSASPGSRSRRRTTSSSPRAISTLIPGATRGSAWTCRSAVSRKATPPSPPVPKRCPQAEPVGADGAGDDGGFAARRRDRPRSGVVHARGARSARLGAAARRLRGASSLRTRTSAAVSYFGGLGDPVLRQALADHLAVNRAVRARPDNIVITAGATAALAAVAHVWLGLVGGAWSKSRAAPSCVAASRAPARSSSPSPWMTKASTRPGCRIEPTSRL